ncbi:MAG TPA: DUF1549 domain-containing protein, partial [Prosthecobacter sp.]|nr:DUF1549 domain-containing protein [Prosthecobacter sp.]
MRFLIPSLLSVAATAQAVDFEQHIRPLLKERCVECHGAAKQKGGLRLDARSLAFKGGDSGAAIVAGNARGSALWRRVASLDEDERMPPKGAPLTPEETAVLKEWLDGGAVWPESQADRDALIDGRLKHWSFQPVRELSAPAVKGGGVRNAIDAFVQARLKEVHLQQAPEADRRTLIRRLSFDLLGLPPAPEAVTAFVEDADPRAHEKLVDRFLMSPQYGERWARHWLDIAHYADTHGFERD